MRGSRERMWRKQGLREWLHSEVPPALERISVWNESVANDLYLHEAPSPGASCLFGRQSLDR